MTSSHAMISIKNNKPPLQKIIHESCHVATLRNPTKSIALHHSNHNTFPIHSEAVFKYYTLIKGPVMEEYKTNDNRNPRFIDCRISHHQGRFYKPRTTESKVYTPCIIILITYRVAFLGELY